MLACVWCHKKWFELEGENLENKLMENMELKEIIIALYLFE